ncbi:D-tagatose-1,6-bisphosphate aldolase subunit KbaZ [subsurface metagenome]|jgi:D-tagatose-1,6-bisphosphate aldolase subunit GatZ/KbaZ
MDDNHPLKKIVEMQKKGIHRGIYSVCSSNEYVIEATLERALKDNDYVLIESTANQVNQLGGYSGMKPEGFKEFIFKIAKKTNFPSSKIMLGGDHLGPLVWQNENSETAMYNAHELIRQYVLAGFTKIHIDTSMRLGDDNREDPLGASIIAERGTALCRTAVNTFKKLKISNPSAKPLVYVIGSEVPIPGGSQDAEKGIQITKVHDFIETVEVFEKTFKEYSLDKVWQDVIAIVVQPGVEFGDNIVHGYNREAAKELCRSIKNYPNIVFEGHSTDYQTAFSLRQMVEDGIAILKVGPALTFALREGLFALNLIENELFKHNPGVRLSNFINVLDDIMVKNPENWKKYYHGSEIKIRLARKYSLLDRCRYYLDIKEVKEAIKLMINNLRSVQIPLALISQFMPVQYKKIRCGILINDPEEMLKDRIINCIDDYVYATSLPV